jgi:ribonucleoside-diphosphate reductase alpha chain
MGGESDPGRCLCDCRATATAATSSAAGTLLAERVKQARMKGYEGDPCSECGQLTLVRSGACAKCDTCGATSGCS